MNAGKDHSNATSQRGADRHLDDEKATPSLTDRDQREMTNFLSSVLDDYMSGQITKQQAVGGLQHVMIALDVDNYVEAREWFQQGRKFIRQQ